MLVSVLIPSRCRPLRLKKTLQSIIDTVDDLTRVEALVRYDTDDIETETFLGIGGFVDLTRAGLNVTYMLGHRMKGYSSLNLMYTELAEIARGGYVMIMNDDCWFVTKGWDTALAALPEGDNIIQFDTIEYGCYCGGPFPIVRNQIWKRFDQWAIADPADTQLDQLLRVKNGFNTLWLEKFYLKHDRDRDEVLAEHRKL